MRRTAICVLIACMAASCVIMLSACGQGASTTSSSSSSFDSNVINDNPTSSSPAKSSSTSKSQSKGGSSSKSQSKSSSKSSSAPDGAVVVIDAGHQLEGNNDEEPIGPGASETKPKVSSGTAGTTTGVPEYQVNLDVALKLQRQLKAKGVTVYMVRTTNEVDISNSERAEFANKHHATIFVRLHCDGVDDSSTSGFMTLYPGANEFVSEEIAETSKIAAELMHEQIVKAIGANDRGAIERTDLSGFNWCKVPSVLFEMGCMTNPAEDEKLASDDYQQTLAKAMANAIISYTKQAKSA